MNVSLDFCSDLEKEVVRLKEELKEAEDAAEKAKDRDKSASDQEVWPLGNPFFLDASRTCQLATQRKSCSSVHVSSLHHVLHETSL